MVLDDPVRGSTRRRAGWLAVTVAGAMVLGFFLVAVAIYLLTVRGPAFTSGDLTALSIVLGTSLGVTALGAYRLRVLDRRLLVVAGEHGFGAWLPPAGATDEGSIDLGAQTARLRGTARRAAALVLVWVALFAGGFAGMSLLDRAAADLLADGVPVPGVVLTVHEPAKGTAWIVVRYGPRTAEIVRDSGRRYHAGEAVTVIEDRADPERVRTAEEKNENQVLFGLSIGSLLLGLGGVPFAAGVAVGRRRRARAVAATGWRLAAVDVVPDRSAGRRRHPPDVHVRYRDGTGTVLRAMLSTHGVKALADYTDRRAWIGGWGRQMVVLFPHGPRRPGPHAVPVSATRLRLSRSRR